MAGSVFSSAQICLPAMAADSLSFRITRTAEDLAQTVRALSERLVRLEQRLGALELQAQVVPEADPRELDHLASVDRLLQDCRSLLESSEPEAAGIGKPGLGVAGEQEAGQDSSTNPYHQVA